MKNYDTVANKYWLISQWVMDHDITPIGEFEMKVDFMRIGTRLLVKFENQRVYSVYEW